MDRVGNTSPSGRNVRPGQLDQPSLSKIRREDQDEGLEYSSPTDNRSDEKVIVNAQRTNKTVKEPSQAAVDTKEALGNDEKRLDDR